MSRTGARSALLLALALVLAFPLTAGASSDPVGGGLTRITLDKHFATLLERAGISVTVKDGAVRRGRTLLLPVTGGTFDPTAGRGEVEQQGAIVFNGPHRRLPLRRLVVKATAAPLVAKVGGSQLKVATSKATRSGRQGFGALFRARELRLTAKVATRLNKKLRPRQPFETGQLIGTLTTEVQPLVTNILPVGRANLVFDPAFLAKLDQHFVSLNPIAPAERMGSTITVPIIPKGALSPEASTGTLRTGGEIEFLQLSAGQVFWHESWFDLGSGTALAEVDLEPTPAFPGKVGQIPVLSLGEGVIETDSGARTISITAAPLALAAETAAAFNRAFASGKNDFEAGEMLGTLSFLAKGQ